jgi:UrcA family protein
MNASISTKYRAAIHCIFGAAALFSLSAPARATDDASKRVRFDDLNIAEPAGAKILYRRIRAAASEVCASYYGSNPVNRALVRACVEKAIDDAVMKVNAPALTALAPTRNIRVVGK